MQQKSKACSPETVRDWLDAMTNTSSLETICEPFQPTRGVPATLALAVLIHLSVYHEIAPSGTRAMHAADVAGVRISDSAISQRLQGLDPDLFQTVLDQMLRPIAQRRRHPQAFYQVVSVKFSK